MSNKIMQNIGALAALGALALSSCAHKPLSRADLYADIQKTNGENVTKDGVLTCLHQFITKLRNTETLTQEEGQLYAYAISSNNEIYSNQLTPEDFMKELRESSQKKSSILIKKRRVEVNFSEEKTLKR